MVYEDFNFEDNSKRLPDLAQERARAKLETLFEERQEEVFFSRQLEVLYEDEFFHWVTNRALRDLIEADLLHSETRELKTGGTIKVVWHRRYRYYRRAAKSLIALVEEYADPNIGAALGLHGESMVLEGFARSQFVMRGKNTCQYGEKEWKETSHDLDFIFERDGIPYGIEVKNTLGYMDYDEFKIKIRMCHELGIRPLFAIRMIPKPWVYELHKVGGFALILKYQLYPWAHKELAKRVKMELGLPVDAPRVLAEGTMKRFLAWHRKNV